MMGGRSGELDYIFMLMREFWGYPIFTKDLFVHLSMYSKHETALLFNMIPCMLDCWGQHVGFERTVNIG